MRDRALTALFETALAGDPTLFDIGVVDTHGRVLAHSDPSRVGEVVRRRPPLRDLARDGFLRQTVRLLGPPRAYDEVVTLRAGRSDFGEVRVGVSSAQLREERNGWLLGGRSGMWLEH